MPRVTASALCFAASLAAAAALPAAASDYRATADSPAVLYDAPSAKAKALFVYGRDVPMEVLVNVEGWTKVRDSSGTIGWLSAKSLGGKRMLLVRGSSVDVRANPEESAAVVFRAEQNVLLELAETAGSASSTGTPGWVKVRHRDGQTGYVRISQVFGL